MPFWPASVLTMPGTQAGDGDGERDTVAVTDSPRVGDTDAERERV